MSEQVPTPDAPPLAVPRPAVPPAFAGSIIGDSRDVIDPEHAATPHGHGHVEVLERAAAADATVDLTGTEVRRLPAGHGLVEVHHERPDAATRVHLEAAAVSAWFGDRKVLEQVDLQMRAQTVTALIGPSGCGKSTFLRILNRMHESVLGAALAGEVRLDGDDIYAAGTRLTETRRRIGMVFQKPNPFPTMSIGDNVTAGLKLTGRKVARSEKADLIERCLSRAGLWTEVRDRLDTPGGALSGGQQQRLCIARSLAVDPEVLLMDEPCSALDPASTRRIEQTIADLREEVTIVIVTHNMQQAARVSQQCAFFLAEPGTPGGIVESGRTEDVFERPVDPRTSDYVNGRFG